MERKNENSKSGIKETKQGAQATPSRSLDQRPIYLQLRLVPIHNLSREGCAESPHSLGKSPTTGRRLRKRPQDANWLSFKATTQVRVRTAAAVPPQRPYSSKSILTVSRSVPKNRTAAAFEPAPRTCRANQSCRPRGSSSARICAVPVCQPRAKSLAPISNARVGSLQCCEYIPSCRAPPQSRTARPLVHRQSACDAACRSCGQSFQGARIQAARARPRTAA